MHAALSPYGVIDFASNATSAASPDLAAMLPPGTITGGPPAYLEAHGIRYVPSMDHLGSDVSAYDPTNPTITNPLFVPMMGDPDGGGGPLDSAPTGPAVYVSPHDLNSRVDDRIRRFMDLQQSAAMAAAPATRDTVDARLRNLRRDCEMAAQASAAPARGDGSAARLRQLQMEACKAAGGPLMASRASAPRAAKVGSQYRYDY